MSWGSVAVYLDGRRIEVTGVAIRPSGDEPNRFGGFADVAVRRLGPYNINMTATRRDTARLRLIMLGGKPHRKHRVTKRRIGRLMRDARTRAKGTRGMHWRWAIHGQLNQLIEDLGLV